MEPQSTNTSLPQDSLGNPRSTEQLADENDASQTERAPEPSPTVQHMLENTTALKELDHEQQGAELIKKGMILMGLSDEFVGTERGHQLKQDAALLLRYAHELRTSSKVVSEAEAELSNENSAERKEVVGAAQSLLDSLATKYESHGSGVLSETQKLWDELSTSQEAQDFAQQGWAIVDQWKEYGDSAEGKALLEAASSTLGEHGLSLLDTLSAYTREYLKDGATHAQTIDEIAAKASAVLSADEDVKALLESGQSWIAQQGEGEKKGKKEDQADQTEQAGDEAENEKPKAEKADKKDEKEEKDSIVQASLYGQQVLSEFRQKKTGHELMKKGSVVLSELQQMRPEEVVDTGKQLYNDPNARAKFLVKVKDAALEFLLQYLPTVEVPPVSGVKEDIYYELSHIDLGGFKLRSEDVTVAITDTGVEIRASRISCLMRGLNWKYKQQRFPYLGSAGVADAAAGGATFHMALDVVGWDEKADAERNARRRRSSVSSSSSMSTSAPSSEPLELSLSSFMDEPASSSAPSRSRASSSASTPSASPSRRSSTSSAAVTPTKPKTAQPTPASSSSPSSSSASTTSASVETERTRGFSVSVDDFLGSSSSSSVSSSSSASSPSSSSPSSPSSSMSSSASSSSSSSSLSILSAPLPSDLRLELSSCHISMPHLELQISGGWMAWVYNFLVQLFSDLVRSYIESKLNEVITEKSSELLTTVNGFVKDYLPVLAKLKTKGSKVLENMNQAGPASTSASKSPVKAAPTSTSTASAPATPTSKAPTAADKPTPASTTTKPAAKSSR